MKWLLRKWDMWIYRRAFHSLRRICESTPGFARVLELHIHDYVAQSNCSKASKESAEQFYEAMKKIRKVNHE